MREAVGAVEALWRFPVKAMRAERLEAADVTEVGVVGDRAFALRDLETGEVVNAKHSRLGRRMMRCRATPSSILHVSVLTTSTLDRCTALRLETRFDARRFRMNVILRTPAEGFVVAGSRAPGRPRGAAARRDRRPAVRGDDDAPGRTFQGPAGAEDARPAQQALLAGRSYPCAGVYASVDAAGPLRAGDGAWLR